MDWGFHPYLADLLAQRGVAALRFNFSGSGVAPGEDSVTDPQAFRDATYSRDLEDLLAVLDSVDRLAPTQIDPQKLGIFGHSRGGGAALLAAASSPETNKVGALVTWNSIGEAHRFRSVAEQWRTDGELMIPNGRTGQILPISLDLLDDIERHAASSLDLRAAATRRSCPWLLLHGTADETVDLAEGEAMAEVASPPFELHRVSEGSHTFGAKHPFQGPTPQLIEAMNATQEWFIRYLRSS